MVLMAAATMVVTSPNASAAPQNFPDLQLFVPVNADQYRTEFGYATEGVRFSTPDGLHCSLSHNLRGSESVATCRGDLPGAGGVTGILASSYVPTLWQEVDLSQPEMYLEMEEDGSRDVPVDPAAFRPLPAGSRIEFENISCAVDDARMTACLIASASPDLVDHGFVLQPSGSVTF